MVHYLCYNVYFFLSQPNGEMSNNNNNSVDVIKVDQLDRELSQLKEVNKKIAEKLTLVEQENHVLKAKHQESVPKADYCRQVSFFDN